MLHAVKLVSKQMLQALCYHPKGTPLKKDKSLAAGVISVAPRSGADSTSMYSSEDEDDGKSSFEPEEGSGVLERQEAPPKMTLCHIATFRTENTSGSMDAISILTDDDDQLDDELSTTTGIHLEDIFDETTISEPDSMCTEDPPTQTHYVPQIDAWELEHYDLMIIPHSSN